MTLSRPFCLAALLAVNLMAQCDPQWLPGDPIPFASGSAAAKTTWDPDGAGPLGPELVVGGLFQAGFMASTPIASFDGSQWSHLGTPPGGSVQAPGQYNGLLVGAFRVTASSTSVATWNGTTWQTIGVFTGPGNVKAMASYNGLLYVGGSFSSVAGLPASNIARWNGATWQPLGTGLSSQVFALAVMANGDVVAGGTFLSAGGVAANRVARWNGANWFPLGIGVDNWVTALAVLPNGQLAVGGSFQTAGGLATGPVAKWNGSAWSTTAAPWGPSSDVHALKGLPDGDVVAGGSPWPWRPSGLDYTILARLSDHSGLHWGPPVIFGQDVNAMTTLANGDLIVVGYFQDVGGLASGNVARYAATCRAQATTYGTGCAGVGGANVLTATSLPWTGSAFRGLATGMPTSGIAAMVTGFSAISMPVASVLPHGLPGCSLLVAPDLLAVAVPSGGSIVTQLMLPDSVALAGIVFDQQVVPFELDAGGSVSAVTSTNALQLTIGTF